MCMYVPISPHVPEGLVLSYNLLLLWLHVSVCIYMPLCNQWVETQLFTHSSVCNCYYTLQCVSMCPPLQTHVYVCTHFPPCGQWFDSQLQPLRLVVHCVLMCQYVPMYPHMASSLSQSWNLQYMMSIENPWVCMYPCAPMWVMVVDSAIISNICYPLWTHVSECAHVPPYGQFIES